MLSFMLVMVPMVFFINGLFKHNWKDSSKKDLCTGHATNCEC